MEPSEFQNPPEARIALTEVFQPIHDPLDPGEIESLSLQSRSTPIEEIIHMALAAE